MSPCLADADFCLGNPAFVQGRSQAIQALNAMVEEIAPTNIPVLLEGESGTGKEIYGRVIHRLSKNKDRQLTKVNCRALEQEESVVLLRTNFKGRECKKDELRTLFLDGIDELDLGSQKVLLSFLPDGEADYNGTERVRTIASTSRNLEKEVESGRFRRELYFRINGVCLRLPPLRNRREDIPVLMEHFLSKHAAEVGRATPVFSNEDTEFLQTYNWPGNVRELENFARKIVALGDPRRAMEQFREMSGTGPTQVVDPGPLSLKVAARAASRRAERDLISKALEHTHWNRKRAAQELQISYKSLLYKIKQTGLEEDHKERG